MGRAEQLDCLHAGLRRALAGQGAILFVTGEAGAGKTALLRAFVHQALDAHPDLLVGFGACSALAGMGDPYQPFREALVMLTGDLAGPLASGLIAKEHAMRLWQAVPETLSALVEHGPALAPALLSGGSLLERAASALRPADATLSRLRRLVETGAAASGSNLAQLCGQYGDVAHALAERGPVLLVLDDLQWSDPGSAGLLFHLSRALADARVCIIGAFRPEEVTLNGRGPQPMAKVVAEVKSRYGELDVALDHIEPDARREFVDALLDSEPNALDERFRAALFDRTEGHALFTVETLRNLRERGQLVTAGEHGWIAKDALDWSTVPLRVSGVIEERLERLSPTHLRLLNAASVEGEHFTAQVAARAAGLDERSALHDLEHELSRAHALVAYEGTITIEGQVLDRFCFRNNLFQRHVYDRLGHGERRLLHGDVGAALEALYGERADELASDLGWHFEQAGDAKRAILHPFRAGDQARLAFAHDAAIGFYRRAAALLEQQEEEDGLARTLMRLALTHHANYDYEISARTYAQAFEAWRRARRERRGATTTRQRFRFVMNSGFTAGSLTPFVYRGLVSTSADLEVLPDLAESWEVERDGMRYIFQLRDDARWSDGRPIVAEDFACAWRFMLRPGAAFDTARLLYDIRGAEGYHTGVTSDADAIGLRTRGPRTLVVDLIQPTASFLHLLTSECLHPVPAPTYTPLNTSLGNIEQWIVSGPYKVKEYRVGRMLLERNPEYQGRFDGNVEQIEVFEYEDCAHDQLKGLEWYDDDALDVLSFWDYPAAIRSLAVARHPDEVMTVLGAETFGFAFDASRPPFDDVRVRRAFCMAFDRARFNRTCRNATQPTTGGVLPPRIPGYTPGIEPPFDPPAARALLAEAGYPNGRGLPRLSYIGITSTGCEETRRYFQETYAENLGIDPDIYDVFEPRCDPWWHDMFETRKTVGSIYWVIHGYYYPDPDNFLYFTYDTMIRNHGGWQDPKYDRIITEARVTSDYTRASTPLPASGCYADASCRPHAVDVWR